MKQFFQVNLLQYQKFVNAENSYAAVEEEILIEFQNWFFSSHLYYV